MLTAAEMLRAILVPIGVALLIALIGRWRKWAWLMPVAAGAGFLVGYALLAGIPSLPPRDGTDWLFWAAIPLMLLAVADALAGGRWGWLLGAAAGGAAFLVAHPLLSSGGITPTALWGTTAAFAAGGMILSLAARQAEPRIGPWAVIGGLCIAVGGAAVAVLSSNQRVGGVYGLAAAAGLGVVAVVAGRLRTGRSIAILTTGLLAAFLMGGHYYVDPGVTWTQITILTAAPLLLLAGAAIPGKRNWLRGLVAVVLIGAVVGAIAGPTALAAKKAAEADPYAAYRQ